MNNIAEQVKGANREFYDRVGSSYESLDGRRSSQLATYVKDQITGSVRPGTRSWVLDLGCGNGFVSRVVRPYFERRYALDLSWNVIKEITDRGVERVQGDCDVLPFQDGSFDCVVAFAVLHHCYGYEELVEEIFRVLKSGGVFYSDHDMDIKFFDRFGPLVRLYRRMKGVRNLYKGCVHGENDDLYRCSEIHEDGIPSPYIRSLLETAGFRRISVEFHWYGLSAWTNLVFGKKVYKQGRAPLARILAVK